jgi:hypothetical protein
MRSIFPAGDGRRDQDYFSSRRSVFLWDVPGRSPGYATVGRAPQDP